MNLPEGYVINKSFAYGMDFSGAAVTNIPEGVKVRLRFRKGAFAEAFIKWPLACTRHYLRVVEGGLELTTAREVNRKLP